MICIQTRAQKNMQYCYLLKKRPNLEKKYIDKKKFKLAEKVFFLKTNYGYVHSAGECDPYWIVSWHSERDKSNLF